MYFKECSARLHRRVLVRMLALPRSAESLVGISSSLSLSCRPPFLAMAVSLLPPQSFATSCQLALPRRVCNLAASTVTQAFIPFVLWAFLAPPKHTLPCQTCRDPRTCCLPDGARLYQQRQGQQWGRVFFRHTVSLCGSL